MWYETIIDRGILPDWALRMFVRQGLKQYDRRVSGIDSNTVAINQASLLSFVVPVFPAIGLLSEFILLPVPLLTTPSNIDTI